MIALLFAVAAFQDTVATVGLRTPTTPVGALGTLVTPPSVMAHCLASVSTPCAVAGAPAV